MQDKGTQPQKKVLFLYPFFFLTCALCELCNPILFTDDKDSQEELK